MFKKMMLSCFKATELIERSSVVKLSSMERIQLKLHLSVCDVCKKYQSQSDLIDKAMMASSDSKALSDAEVDQFEVELIKKIKESDL